MASKADKPAAGQRRRGRPPKGTRGDTRQELLDAALKLFARQGYKATTVRQIGDEVGVRDSAIYAHFNAKKELLDGLVEEAGPHTVDRLQYDFSAMGDSDPREALPELFDRLIAEWNKPRNRLLMGLLTREGLLSGSDLMGPLRERLEKPFRQWSRSGLFTKRFPIETLLWEMTAPLGAVRLLYLTADVSPAVHRKGRELARQHVEFFISTVIA